MEKKQKHIDWLEQELPNWVRRGLITSENATTLKSHYRNSDGTEKRDHLLVIFSSLGAVLVGVGIILLLAYNWREMPRSTRTILSMGLLCGAQGLAGWALWKKYNNPGWREGTSVFLTLAIGASLALIAQTYHIPGQLNTFLLTWMFLALPLVYIMGSVLTANLYMLGNLVWLIDSVESPNACLYWLYLMPLIPFFLHWKAKDPYKPAFILSLWVLLFLFIPALGMSLADSFLPSFLPLVYLGFFSTLYLLDPYIHAQASESWQRPFHWIGSTGIVVLSFILSTDWLWDEISRQISLPPDIGNFHLIVDGLLTGGFFMATLLLLLRLKRPHYPLLLWGIAPILGLLGQYTVSLNIIIPLLIFNIYIISIGSSQIMEGIRNQRQGTVNNGLFILSLLIFLRFIDSDLGLIARGIAFVFIGCCFLITNLWIIKSWRIKNNEE